MFDLFCEVMMRMTHRDNEKTYDKVLPLSQTTVLATQLMHKVFQSSLYLNINQTNLNNCQTQEILTSSYFQLAERSQMPENEYQIGVDTHGNAAAFHVRPSSP